MKTGKLLGSLALVAATVGASGHALAPAAAASPAGAGQARAAAAVLGVTEAEAQRRLDAQPEQTETAERLIKELGEAQAGAWIDTESGELKVGVLDEAGAEHVREAGAVPVLVKRSAAELDRVRESLDEYARGKKTGGHAWAVDVPTNTVLVTVADNADPEESERLLAHAGKHGESVRVERLDGAMVSNGIDVRGGEKITARGNSGQELHDCSVGFSAVDRIFGMHQFLTAGHCMEPAIAEWRKNGLLLGHAIATAYPGNDYASILHGNLLSWNTSGYVVGEGGAALPIRGHVAGSHLAGSLVCKSGQKTGWTCGTITNNNVTNDYGDGPVHGNVRTGLCSETGDSGGSVVKNGRTTANPRWLAAGLVSGGVSYRKTANGPKIYCGAKVGQLSVNFYQPIEEVLTNLNLNLVTVPE
ncbi:S1 family peptidase [Streptomyces sp. NPDC005805]|uniref:S1 family peptidase n=1 Tax=Streptomyces sp. NPDC005805 TaxID=3157068 RepID=UPI0033F1A4B6